MTMTFVGEQRDLDLAAQAAQAERHDGLAQFCRRGSKLTLTSSRSAPLAAAHRHRAPRSAKERLHRYEQYHTDAAA
jgi:hypothetical protein